MKNFLQCLILVICGLLLTGAVAEAAKLEISGPVLITFGETSQHSPNVAWNGNVFLVVWSDDANGGTVRAARLSPDGSVIDPEGIIVGAGEAASVASNFDESTGGSDFFAVWQRSGTLYSALISADGIVQSSVVLDDGPVDGRPVLAFNGFRFLVAWAQPDGGLFARRVNSKGVPEGEDFEVYRSEYFSNPSVTAIGEYFFLAWEEAFQDIVAARISTGGDLWDSQGISLVRESHNQINPAVTATNSEYLIVWDDFRREGYRDNYAQRVAFNGEILDETNGYLIAKEPTAHMIMGNPSVSSDGGESLVVRTVYPDGFTGDVWMAFLDENGKVFADLPVIQDEKMQGKAVVLAGEGRELVVFEQWTEQDSNIHAVFVDYVDCRFCCGHIDGNKTFRHLLQAILILSFILTITMGKRYV